MLKLLFIFTSLLSHDSSKLSEDESQRVFVTATIYHAVEAQTDSTPHITASGYEINMKDPLSDRIIAVSWDLEWQYGFKMGTMVHVQGTDYLDGIWFVRDRMNKRWSKRIDFLVPESIPGGKWENVILTHKKSFYK
jgi:3D (Asp-Asp-Asp) domain-containing protein